MQPNSKIIISRMVEQQIGKQKKFREFALKEVNKKVNEAKREMVAEFNSHPVTKEIEMGSKAENISGTLGGYGNLFTFIGFEKGEDPIAPIRSMLEKIIVSYESVNKGRFIFKIQYPSKEELFTISPMPWASSRSWLQGIELGMSGLGSYLYKGSSTISKSRSGSAVQIKSNLGRGRFKNTQYISNIIKKFTTKIQSI